MWRFLGGWTFFSITTALSVLRMMIDADQVTASGALQVLTDAVGDIAALVAAVLNRLVLPLNLQVTAASVTTFFAWVLVQFPHILISARLRLTKQLWFSILWLTFGVTNTLFSSSESTGVSRDPLNSILVIAGFFAVLLVLGTGWRNPWPLLDFLKNIAGALVLILCLYLTGMLSYV